jgi:CRISPR-associated protein Csd1
MSVPRSPVNRNSGEHPLLATDDIAYVLGPGAWTPDKAADKEKAAKHHESFVALLRLAAEQSKDEALAACVLFYDQPEEVEKARAALHEAKAGALVALSVGGALVERPAVQAYWREHYDAAFSDRMEGSLGECLISGKHGAIAPTHEKIKGVASLGGQAAGVALMSFDKEAFRSYGWERNQNSPVSPGRAMAYVLALNDLLKTDKAARTGKGERIDIAGVGFLAWLRDPADYYALEILQNATPEQVAALLKFDPRADLDPNRFYMVGVSGNGGRLRVRCWVTESLTELKLNLRNWHEQLRIAYPWDDPGPVRFRRLLYAIHREGKPPADVTIALLRRGIEGRAQQPLGYSMLAAVLNHLRHPGGNGPGAKDKQSDPLSLARLRIPMGLIRMCVNDIALTNRQEGAKEMREGLDQSCVLPAYVCGRLMAEFENLQRASSESEVNSSVLDRYFALASTYPAVAFPKIESLAQKHLRKLRRDKASAAYAIDGRLQELHNLLQPSAEGAYPGKLSLEGQGLFALGYYHQKSWSITQAKDRKQANASADIDTVQEN